MKLRFRMTALGTLFALVAGSNSVAQFDDEFNVKFRANRLSNWLALADHLRTHIIVCFGVLNTLNCVLLFALRGDSYRLSATNQVYVSSIAFDRNLTMDDTDGDFPQPHVI